MPQSQNAMFRGTALPDPEYSDPPGASLVRLLAAHLGSSGWNLEAFDNWRDSGWCLPCSRRHEAMEIVVGSYDGSDSWILQIAAAHYPSFLWRWFGAQPSADAAAIMELARDVHAILASAGFTQFRWRWDGPPDEGNVTNSPQPPAME